MKSILTAILLVSLWAGPAGAEDNGAFGGSGGPPPRWPVPQSMTNDRIYVTSEDFNTLLEKVKSNGGETVCNIEGQIMAIYGFDDILLTGEAVPRRVLSQ